MGFLYWCQFFSVYYEHLLLQRDLLNQFELTKINEVYNSDFWCPAKNVLHV